MSLFQARENIAKELGRAGIMIHSNQDPAVIAGQGDNCHGSAKPGTGLVV